MEVLKYRGTSDDDEADERTGWLIGREREEVDKSIQLSLSNGELLLELLHDERYPEGRRGTGGYDGGGL